MNKSRLTAEETRCQFFENEEAGSISEDELPDQIEEEEDII